MMLSKLVDNASSSGGNHVKSVLADGMSYSNNNFRYLSKNHIKPCIKTRSNSKVKSTNCHARNMSVIRQQTNLKRWKHSASQLYVNKSRKTKSDGKVYSSSSMYVGMDLHKNYLQIAVVDAKGNLLENSRVNNDIAKIGEF